MKMNFLGWWILLRFRIIDFRASDFYSFSIFGKTAFKLKILFFAYNVFRLKLLYGAFRRALKQALVTGFEKSSIFMRLFNLLNIRGRKVHTKSFLKFIEFLSYLFLLLKYYICLSILSHPWIRGPDLICYLVTWKKSCIFAIIYWKFETRNFKGKNVYRFYKQEL